jgi:competence protein ComEC
MTAPAALIAIPLLVGVIAGVLLDSGPPFSPVAIAVAWVVMTVTWRKDPRAFVMAVAAAGFAAGAALGGAAERDAHGTSLLRWYESGRPEDAVRVSGVLREDAAVTANGASMTLDVDHVGDEARDGGVRVSVSGSLAAAQIPSWRAGRSLTLTTQLREPVDYRNPGVPGDRERLARQGIVLLGSTKSSALVTLTSRGGVVSEAAAALRAHVRTTIAAAVGRWSPTSAGVVIAILIGDRSGLDQDDERRLQEAGTYHVIAISGGNIALLTALLIAIGRVLRLPPRGTAAASIALLGFYGYLAGLAPSVLRATVAGTVYLAARAVDHRGPAMNALAVAAAYAAVTAPLTVLDPGFILSFGATVAIVAGASRLAPAPAHDRDASAAHQFARRLLKEGRSLAAATICAEIALAPIGARIFGRVSFAGLILNFAAIPLMSIIQVAGLIAVATAPISMTLASAAGWAAHVGTIALMRSAALVDVAPWLVLDLPPPAFWTIALWYLACAAVFVSIRPRIRFAGISLAAAVAALLCLSPRVARAYGVPAVPRGWTRVAVLDVGQGDATIVWPAGSRPLLVDAGGAPGGTFDLGRRVTLPASWAFGVHRLDALVLTHGDPDHIGGAPAILRALAPHEVWEGIPVPRHEPLRALRDAAARAGIPWKERRAGDTLTLGAATIHVLNPPEPDWERQKVRNDDSIVLEVVIGDVAIVLPGDIGAAVEPAVASAFVPAPMVIVKAPHHGSAGSSSRRFIEALHPAAVIFSAGRRNPFGHPAPVIVDRYRRAGAHVFNTADDGAVVVDTDGTNVVIWTMSERREISAATSHGAGTKVTKVTKVTKDRSVELAHGR